jgi:hypothetical protein
MKKVFVLLMLGLIPYWSQAQALQVVQYNLNKTGQCNCNNTNTVFKVKSNTTTVRTLQIESSMVFDRYGVFERQIKQPQQVKQHKIQPIQFKLWRF